MAYTDEHAGGRDSSRLCWGVESICAQLTELGVKIAPATYYEHHARKPTARQVRDEQLKPKHRGARRELRAPTRTGRYG